MCTRLLILYERLCQDAHPVPRASRLDFNLGQEPADTFWRNQHPDLQADYILANPPFNIADWGGERLVADPRWASGTPPAVNANFAWLQHVLHHLAPGGQAGVVLGNGSLSST